MIEDRQPFGEDDLTAYVDERLTPERLAAVERYIEENPAIQAQVSADRAAREILRRRLDPIADLPIPARLRVDAIMRRRQDMMRRRVGSIAACVTLLLGGVGLGWEARELAPQRLASNQQVASSATALDAISAHRIFVVETVHPVEVAAAQQAHLIQWLSRRVGHPLAVPDLAAQGYVLMGGRLLPAGNEAAAQFMYESTAGHRLTVYVRAAAATTRNSGLSNRGRLGVLLDRPGAWVLPLSARSTGRSCWISPIRFTSRWIRSIAQRRMNFRP